MDLDNLAQGQGMENWRQILIKQQVMKGASDCQISDSMEMIDVGQALTSIK
jgi:hypothetical protein